MGRRPRAARVERRSAAREAARALVDAAPEAKGAAPLSPAAYTRAVRALGRQRGRPLAFPLLLGRPDEGAYLRLADGRRVLDWIGGIGVYAFGHGDRDLLETAALAGASAPVFQGHLLPGLEQLRLGKLLLRHASPRLRHVWLSLSGAMANENALKLIWQKHAPADRIVCFAHGFAGRTTTMAELTDKPAFREGLPLRGVALHVPFFDPRARDPIAASLAALDAHLARHPGQVAAMLFELVQGEGGIRTAPREFFVALMDRCRKAGIAVWVDEVQTYARTGELFAHRTLGLEDFVDVVTAGKALQGSAVLFHRAYNPKPGLVSGTYAGASVGMAVGARIIERLDAGGFLGPRGRVAKLGRRVLQRLTKLARAVRGAVSDVDGIGAMWAFTAFDGSQAAIEAVIRAALDEGLLVFSAGARPARVRLLLPVNTTAAELTEGMAKLERALRRVASERGAAC
jgi:4-aminobutyrate aminotransferase/(S)-3-amino-2-methylpropionate transaminase